MQQSTESDGDSDWFNKDEEEIVNDLKNKTRFNDVSSCNESTEHIYGPGLAEEYRMQQNNAGSLIPSTCQNASRLSLEELQKVSEMKPLDVFLYAFTSERDFFVDQIRQNDSLKRVLLYTHILALICDLQLPDFHEDFLKRFMAMENLLEEFCLIVAKLFDVRYKNAWIDGENVDSIVYDMQTLLAQAYQFGILSPKALDIMSRIKKMMEMSNAPMIKERTSCIKFSQYLEQILCQRSNANSIEYHEGNVDEIFPTHDELELEVAGSSSTNEEVNLSSSDNNNNITDYIVRQKRNLREDFMIPLRSFVHALQRNETPASVEKGLLAFYDNVHIVVNEQFLDARRHEMIFVDFLHSQRGRERDSIRSNLKLIKSGALLCFATTKEFENLILATVTYTDDDILNAGYIGIELAYQYNIGRIYDIPLLMFESPAFFEPYRAVYNSLIKQPVFEFPMQEYIVNGETKPQLPKYLEDKPNPMYTYENTKFSPLQLSTQLPTKLPLNSSQALAYKRALTQKFCLIQGPPGTGKTHLSIQVVRTLMENAAKPIVLITYTNESLDKFIMKLSAYTDDIVRFGNQTRVPEIDKYNVRDVDREVVNPQLKRLYYLTNLKFKEQFQKLQIMQREFDGTEESYQQIMTAQRAVRRVLQQLNTIRILFRYYGVREKGIIAMTTTFAAKTNFLFRLLKCSIFLFEEAAEILESHVVACLTPYTEHVIMIGDHMQLQPYTASYHHSRLTALNVSLFERLIKNGFEPTVLQTQYRMRPAIAKLITPIIYEELHNDEVVETYPDVRKMQANLFFLTHLHEESQKTNDSSIYNKFEIEEMIKLATHLIINAEYKPEDIVILSPYANQIARIRKMLAKNPSLMQINASTVDSFQGLEANIVLLSLVRSNTKGEIGFLKEKNRICVALSRAKHGMFIIGNMQLLSERSATWRAIEQTLKQQNAIGDEFPYEHMRQ